MDERHEVFSTQLDQLASAQTPPIAGFIARSLFKILLLLVIALSLTPWQQNVRGLGRVIAYLPAERQQSISAPVDGRIIQWWVREGSFVKAGEKIAQLQDNDPLFLQRIAEEKQVLLNRQTAINLRVETFRQQLAMAMAAQPQALAAAQARINMAKQRLLAAEKTVDASQAAQKTAYLNIDRQSQLNAKGLSSKRSLELAELEQAQRNADLIRAQSSLDAASMDIEALQADRQKLIADTSASIEKVKADLNKAIEDQNYIQADLIKLNTRLARQENQIITAPREGTVLRLLANPQAELLKPGEAIAILVPSTQQRAVELWVDGNDLPLIVTNSPVRLQFEGYPAIQFGGWPEMSVGSFAGRVVLIDATDDGKGHFRVLVRPDEEDIPWPDARFLRQGVRVNGWILLGRVTLGYELWRVFNGFPPLVLPEVEAKNTDKKAKDTSLKSDRYE